MVARTNPALIAGAIAMVAMGYVAVRADISTKEVEQVIGEAMDLFPEANREEVAVILQAMQILATERTA